MSEARVPEPGNVGRSVSLAPGPEFDLIRNLIAAARAPGDLLVGTGDDAAALEIPASEAVVLSTDLFIEGIHFRRAWMAWETVGYRATAAALSDLAAMAARPIGVLISLGLPPELGSETAEAIGAGVGESLRQFDCALLGGDTTRSPGPVVLDVSAVGSTSGPIGRGGAEAGDSLWVTGRLGAAAAAVADMTHALEPDPRARRAFERPTPRLAEARWLAERLEIKAMIDLSDGLAGDAAQLAAASGVLAEIHTGAVPIAESLAGIPEREAALRLAAAGGEDYELLFAAPTGAVETVRAAFEERFATPLSLVGRIRDGSGVAWIGADGKPRDLPYAGYDHFARRTDDGSGLGRV